MNNIIETGQRLPIKDNNIYDVGKFVEEIGPYFGSGADGLRRLLLARGPEIPENGPGSRSIANAIERYEADLSSSPPQTLKQRRQANLALHYPQNGFR